MPLSVATLTQLWHADNDTAGYWSAELACAVATATAPQTDRELIATFYPGLTLDEVDLDAALLIREGFQLFRRRQKLRP